MLDGKGEIDGKTLLFRCEGKFDGVGKGALTLELEDDDVLELLDELDGLNILNPDGLELLDELGILNELVELLCGAEAKNGELPEKALNVERVDAPGELDGPDELEEILGLEAKNPPLKPELKGKGAGGVGTFGLAGRCCLRLDDLCLELELDGEEGCDEGGNGMSTSVVVLNSCGVCGAGTDKFGN